MLFKSTLALLLSVAAVQAAVVPSGIDWMDASEQSVPEFSAASTENVFRGTHRLLADGIARPFDTKSEKPISGPGFMTVLPSHIKSDGQPKFDLLFSTFNMFSKDALYQVTDIGSKLADFKSLALTEVQSTGRNPLTWPNAVVGTPTELFGQEGVLVAGGFLPPGKNNGGVWFAPYNTDGSLGKLTNIVFTRGWFYHKAVAFDVNGDGQLDILTCRARKPAIPLVPTGGKLVWLQPKDPKSPLTTQWIEQELADGCDVYFELVDLDGDGKQEIIATDFFTKRQITLFWSDDAKNDFSKNIQSIVIDKTIGSPFDVRWVDLNGDGRKDLLATNHAKKGETPSGSVYGYDIPVNYKTEPWKRYTLATDIPVRQNGPFEAAPGTAQTFTPSTKSSFKKPYIMVAGDGSQQAFYLVPKSQQDATNWEYDTVLLYDCQSVVGGIAIEDVDLDGYVEVFVPCYYSGKVNVFTFAPGN